MAIVGTGIAGLACARLLHARHEITLLDANDHVGGHSHTLSVDEAGREIPIDTGFMVFNQVTYPELTRLFKAIDAPVKQTSMSFSVQHRPTGLEYSGSSMNHLFAQRRNLLRPRFWNLLKQINRFNREAIPALQDPRTRSLALSEYVEERQYGSDFLNLYLVPMSSAVWSTPPSKMLGFPASSLLGFFHNHGFLGLHTQHQWWTVDGGSRRYVERLVEPFRKHIQLGDGVLRITPREDGVSIQTQAGRQLEFDKVILACHGDQALALLDQPSRLQQTLLGPFRYQPNLATLHTDARVMPRTRLAWSSWNYRIERGSSGEETPSTIYWMNRLQDVSRQQDYFVSINGAEQIREEHILRQVPYEHPLFDLEAVAAQERLPELNRQSPDQRVYFCGSYFKHGFHEDALVSAIHLNQVMSGRDFDGVWN